MSDDIRTRIRGLPCWTGAVEPTAIAGGMTNENFVVEDAGDRFFVRIGRDIPVHGVLRFNELAASIAAASAGVAPPIVHHEPGLLVRRFVDGRPLAESDIRDPRYLGPVTDLLRRCHDEIPANLRGPVLAFWVFHVARDYAKTILESDKGRAPEVSELMRAAAELERAVGEVRLVFGHNDLLAANFIDDGDRLWLIDWEYAGFNSPLFDLGGLATNSGLSAGQEDWVLERYYGSPPSDDLRRRLAAMKCASLLRETMWSMVSEHHSSVEFDFVAYTAKNRARFEHAWGEFRRSG